VNRLIRKKDGQSAIEFMTVMMVIFFFLFLFLSLSILIVISEYVEYATFMAARTYKATSKSPDLQFENAKKVFESYTSKIEGIARNFNLKEMMADSGQEQTSGVIATYDIDLFYLPPIFALGGAKNPSSITLSAEAYLGRDPSYDECQNFFVNLARRVFGFDNPRLIEQMEDNGC